MIATYIQDLLATNNRVIVPNYGAFLVRATSKSKDAKTLEEKLKDIYFSPFLKFNDELLEKYIIKKENITKEQAAQKITQFIEDIKKELEQEKPYIIEGFGQFEADKQGKVQFSIVTKEPARLSADKAGPAGGKAEKPKEEKKTETKPTTKSKPSTTKKAPVAAKEETKPAEKPKAAEAKKEEIKKESKLEEFKPEKKEPARLSADKAGPTGEEPKATPTAAQIKPIYSYKKEKKPINKGLVWSIAIGLPLAAIFIWALLNFETVKKVLNKEKVKTEEVSKKQKPTTAKKTAVKPKSEQTKSTTAGKQKTTTKAATKPEVKKSATPQKKYYIIAGSFKNEKYAISYLNKLKTDGYNAEKLAERNGMHAVSFNSFADKRKAIAEYKFLAQEKGLQAWILYY
ncbi:MAG: SPOR domain-containing protein [Bacteroidales bacterium]|nr:SPOR domain-containing protein [Bacteroidales bacterium]